MRSSADSCFGGHRELRHQRCFGDRFAATLGLSPGRVMNHQLVLQFQGDDDDTVEKVIELEDRLIDAFAGSTAVEVDGHEPGDGVTNLILLAKNAAKVWEKIEPIVEGAADELDVNAVAFRTLNSEEFTVLWPVDYEGEFELA
jgi:hypothetical protein